MQIAQVAEVLGGEKVLGKKLQSKMDLVELGRRMWKNGDAGKKLS